MHELATAAICPRQVISPSVDLGFHCWLSFTQLHSPRMWDISMKAEGNYYLNAAVKEGGGILTRLSKQRWPCVQMEHTRRLSRAIISTLNQNPGLWMSNKKPRKGEHDISAVLFFKREMTRPFLSAPLPNLYCTVPSSDGPPFPSSPTPLHMMDACLHCMLRPGPVEDVNPSRGGKMGWMCGRLYSGTVRKQEETLVVGGAEVSFKSADWRWPSRWDWRWLTGSDSEGGKWTPFCNPQRQKGEEAGIGELVSEAEEAAILNRRQEMTHGGGLKRSFTLKRRRLRFRKYFYGPLRMQQMMTDMCKHQN